MEVTYSCFCTLTQKDGCDRCRKVDTMMDVNNEPKYVDATPNIPGFFRWIAHVYTTDEKTARNIYFAGWPDSTEEKFIKVVTGKYTIGDDGESVRFID
jgi:hypothetical protein